MRNIDLQISRDYYRETLNITLRTMTAMAKCFDRMEKSYRNRINELEEKLNEKEKV